VEQILTLFHSIGKMNGLKLYLAEQLPEVGVFSSLVNFKRAARK
jgi:hypothetical protein